MGGPGNLSRKTATNMLEKERKNEDIYGKTA